MREEKKLSQGDIEKRTGLLRCYISRVENGHTVPAIETLEKLARALECPLYQLFYDGEEPPQLPNLPKRRSSDDIAWGSTGKDARFLNKLRRLLSKSDEPDRKLLLYMAQKWPIGSRAYHLACQHHSKRPRTSLGGLSFAALIFAAQNLVPQAQLSSYNSYIAIPTQLSRAVLS